MHKLKLIKRDAERRIVLQGRLLQELENMSPDAIASFISKSFNYGETAVIHDVTWLKQIINWVPEGGLPITEMAKWMKLSTKIAELDEDKEYTLTLTPFHVNLIWQRITNEKFKLNSAPQQFLEFILHFQEVTGKHFSEEDPDDIVIEED